MVSDHLVRISRVFVERYLGITVVIIGLLFTFVCDLTDNPKVEESIIEEPTYGWEGQEVIDKLLEATRRYDITLYRTKTYEGLFTMEVFTEDTSNLLKLQSYARYLSGCSVEIYVLDSNDPEVVVYYLDSSGNYIELE